ncbi:MAG: ArsR/SmtB family transcription factor [Nitriliruptoraceae bacterium]
MTAAEAKALGHPTRLRILFACRDEGRTTKQLADALGVSPGTIHHHLRPLVEQGFLVALEPRRGARGAREQPYLATGRSWEMAGTAGTAEALQHVAVEELRAAGGDEVVTLARLGLRLRPEQLEALVERLQALLDELAGAQAASAADGGGTRSPSGEEEQVRVLVAVTRAGGRRPASSGGSPTERAGSAAGVLPEQLGDPLP